MTMTREQKLKVIPPMMRSTYLKSQTSRTAAVKAFCQECCGYDREAVRGCAASLCPLYEWRPYQDADEADGTDDAAGSDETEKTPSKRGEGLKRWREEQKAKKA